MSSTTQTAYLRGDRQIWIIYALLVLFSIVIVTSSVSNLAFRTTQGNTLPHVLTHTLHLLGGFCFVFILPYIHYETLRTWFRYLLWIAPMLMLYTLFFGKSVGAASRWISVFGLISFQTSDFLKLVFVVNLASMLADKQHIQNDEYKLSALNNIIIWGCIYAGLLVFASFSSVVILLGTTLFLMLAGRVPIKHFIRLILYSFVSILLIVSVSIYAERNKMSFPRSETIVERIEAFTGKDLDKDAEIGGKIGKEGTQRIYAQIAVANGGVLGTGPGNSFQKYKLPFVYSDFVYSIIVEEYGLWGGILIIVLYLWLLSRGIKNVDNTKRPFGGLLIVGLTISMVFQAFVHIIVCVGLGPVTGQTLPFISMGGSAIVINSIAIGMILSVTNFDEETPTFIKRFAR